MKNVLQSIVVCAVLATGCALTPPPADPIPMPADPSPPTIDVSGRWVGVARIGTTYSLPYTLDVTQSGATVTGTIDLATQDFVRRATYSIEGIVSGDQFFYEGIRFLRSGTGFCMSSGRLSVQQQDGRKILTGEYGPLSKPDGCPPYTTSTGELFVEFEEKS